MITTAKIVGYDGEILRVKPLSPIDRDLLQKQVDEIEIRLTDGREISADQRRKIFALVRDISDWCGEVPEYIRRYMMFEFRMTHGIKPFSLSDCDMSTAKEFISYLIDFCFTHCVPTRDTLLNRTDDIDKYLYQCLRHRRCAVCNKKADVHHTDAIGMGRNRDEIIHIGMEAIALCREHHQEAHTIGQAFFDRYHIYGIKLDENLCKILNLGRIDNNA